MKFPNMNIKHLLLAGTLLTASTAQAQMSLTPDAEVRTGKLDNGLTYYIRHNNQPEHTANFYIAQKVGSINENDDQRGLAHFLEHMAFNGSEHFPGNGIIEFTRSLGVQFGRDLNAYTGIDQTVYNINNVPTTRQTALDSCLLILKDWSNGLTLPAEEIDKERGVVHSEWRLGSGAQQRMMDKMWPELLAGSKYGNRLPIGLMEIVDSFRPNTLKAYYEKWYHTKNQAIIVVGDVDVDHTEAVIRDLWKNVAAKADALPIPREEVPDNSQAIVVVGKDKEQAQNQIWLMMKHDVYPDSLKNDVSYELMEYGEQMMSAIINERLQELSQKPEGAFSIAQNMDMGFCYAKTKKALTTIILPKEGQEEEAVAQVMTELQRIRQHGFTNSEYERAARETLSQLEAIYTNRDKQDNDFFAQQYVEHFLENEPYLSVSDEYELVSQMLPMIPVDLCNELARQYITESDTNLVIAAFMQDNEKVALPTKEALLSAAAKTRGQTLEPYVDNVIDEPLMASLPKKGKIKKETQNTKLGYKELTLSNGARVILKPTDFKDDEVRFQAVADGGLTAFNETDANDLKMMQMGLAQHGLGHFTVNELQKATAGKQASVAYAIDMTEQTVSGSSTPKDLETLFQLIHLQFTDIKADPATFEQMRTLYLQVFKNKEMNPSLVFADSVQNTVNRHNLLASLPSAEDFERADYDHMLALERQSLANASAYTFTFVGNFDEQTIRPLIEQYIASLPKKGKKLQSRDQRTLFNGEVKNHFTAKMQDPQAQAMETWRSDNLAYTPENRVLLSAAAQYLEAVYLKTIREDESASYTVGAIPQVDTDGKEIYFLLVSQCPCDPEKAELAVRLLKEGMENAAKEVDADMLQKVKEQMLKQFDVDARDNSHWINMIYRWNKFGADCHNTYRQLVQALTPQRIADFLSKNMLASGHHAEIVMMPVATDKE